MEWKSSSSSALSSCSSWEFSVVGGNVVDDDVDDEAGLESPDCSVAVVDSAIFFMKFSVLLSKAVLLLLLLSCWGPKDRVGCVFFMVLLGVVVVVEDFDGVVGVVAVRFVGK